MLQCSRKLTLREASAVHAVYVSAPIHLWNNSLPLFFLLVLSVFINFTFFHIWLHVCLTQYWFIYYNIYTLISILSRSNGRIRNKIRENEREMDLYYKERSFDSYSLMMANILEHSAPVFPGFCPHKRYFILCEQLIHASCSSHATHIKNSFSSLTFHLSSHVSLAGTSRTWSLVSSYYASGSQILSALHVRDCMQRVN